MFLVFFIKILALTYSMHVLINCVVHELSFRVYKTKRESVFWILYLCLYAYVAFRFRIREDISVLLNGLANTSWMLSYFVFAKYSLKLNLKRVLIYGFFAIVAIISLDMLTAFTLFIGFGKVDSSIMGFVSTYIEFAGSIMCLSIAFYIDSRRRYKKPTHNYASSLKLMILPIGISVTYYTLANLLTTNERINIDLIPMNLVVLNGVFITSSVGYMILMSMEARKQQAKALTEIMSDYVSILDDLNGELRHFKHDIENIIFGLREYVALKDMTSLRDYFQKHIKTKSPSESSVAKVLRELKPLNINVLKGSIIREVYKYEGSGLRIRFQTDDIEEVESDALTYFSLLAGELLQVVLVHQSSQRSELEADLDISVEISKKMDAENQSSIEYQIKGSGFNSGSKIVSQLSGTIQKYRKYERLEFETLCEKDLICKVRVLV